MKRVPLLAWIALLAVSIALVATLAADDWLWSLAGNRALQSLGAGLTLPMQLFTFLGDEQFYLVAIPLVYWCLQKELGVDLGVLLVLSSLTNGFLKSLVKHNRPFWEDPKLQLSEATSFSTPSGHAQNSAALFGKLISFLSRSAFRVLWVVFLSLVIILVALSRVYLGVHYPGDVMWGIAVGLVLVSLYNWLKPKLLPGLRRLPTGLHVLLGRRRGGSHPGGRICSSRDPLRDWPALPRALPGCVGRDAGGCGNGRGARGRPLDWPGGREPACALFRARIAGGSGCSGM